MNIGQNIKKYRLKKSMTQEQLADLLCISTAAVSKWEAKNSYPDITMLFPLATIFGVSMDELLGYNIEKERETIQSILQEVRELELNGQRAQAMEILQDARKKYPHEYSVMHRYMWSLIGGETKNDRGMILEHQNELLQLCNCILDGCKNERIRLDALSVQAKICHARGDTAEAIRILQEFPSAHQNANLMTERLFEKGSAEYCYWNKLNLFGLLDITANKSVRAIWFDDTLSTEEKIHKIECLGDHMTALRHDFPQFVVSEQMIFAELANRLSATNDVDKIIRIRKKQIEAMKAMTILAKEDDALKECIIRTYKTDDPHAWLLNWLSTASHEQFVILRQNKRYCQMIADAKKG